MRRLFFAILLLFVYSPSVIAQEALNEADAWLSETFAADKPGITAIVSKGDKTLFLGAYGMADIENSVALTPASVMRIGSLTKQFTAAAILLLQERGLLSVEDPITDYFPDYPMHGYTITIHHLLSHTSGIRNYTDIPELVAEYMNENLTTGEIIGLFADQPMDFAPGSQYRYSNSGYLLLGGIIEKITGGSYEDFIQENIFDPLGLTASYYGGDEKIIPNRARGYARSKNGLHNAPYIHMSTPGGAGALVSTVEDMARWFRALAAGEVVSEESYAAMTTVHALPDGAATSYAYGLATGTLRGRDFVAHSGGINGFNTHALWLREEEIYVAVFANMNGFTPSPVYVAMRLAAMALDDPYPPRVATSVSNDLLGDYVGTYSARPGPTISVKEDSGILTVMFRGRQELQPMGPDVFFVDNTFWRFEFQRDEAGSVTAIEFYPDDETPDPLVLERQTQEEQEK